MGIQPVASEHSLWLLWDAFAEPDGVGLFVCPHRPVCGVTREELITVYEIFFHCCIFRTIVSMAFILLGHYILSGGTKAVYQWNKSALSLRCLCLAGSWATPLPKPSILLATEDWNRQVLFLYTPEAPTTHNLQQTPPYPQSFPFLSTNNPPSAIFLCPRTSLILATLHCLQEFSDILYIFELLSQGSV